MVTKNETEATAGAHHDRMTAFKSKLLSSHPEKAVFGAIDVGTECYWWDYGLLSLYQKNNMLALDDTEEAASLRAYLRIPEDRAQSSELGNDVQVTNGSVVLASVVKEGEIDHTIASRVVTGKCDAHGASRTLVPVRPRSRGCLLINVTARSIKARNCVIYNVVDDSEDGLVLPDGAVLTNVFVPGREKLVQSSSTTTDGGKVFKVRLTPNPFSFEGVYKMNQSTDVKEAYKLGAEAHADLAKELNAGGGEGGSRVFIAKAISVEAGWFLQCFRELEVRAPHHSTRRVPVRRRRRDLAALPS
eukprot:30987-Pelagococcus_subviridis.AAC.3